MFALLGTASGYRTALRRPLRPVAHHELQGGLFQRSSPERAFLAITGVMTAWQLDDLTLGHHVRTRDEVDALMNQAAGAGARIVKSAGATFWGGYAGSSRIRMATSGKWRGTPRFCRRISRAEATIASNDNHQGTPTMRMFVGGSLRDVARDPDCAANSLRLWGLKS